MSKRFRILLVLAFIGVGVFFLYPTVQWYFFIPESDKELAAGSREQVREYARTQSQQALEELTALAESDETEVVPDEYSFLTDVARDNFRLDDRDIPEQWSVAEVLSAFRDREEIFSELEDHYAGEIFALKDLKSRIITLGLDLSGGMSVVVEADEESLADRLGRPPTADELDESIDLAMTILTSRIDQFGVTEPIVRRQEGTNQILIEVPGDNDRSRIEAYLQGRGSLNFHIVDDEATAQLIELQQLQPGFDPESDGVPEFIPAGTTVAPYVVPDQYGILRFVRYIAIKENVDEFGLSGEHITEARVGSEPLTNQPTVNFVLDAEGANI